ncbi:MAG TPA: hypothetical protein VMM36_02405 [Opitutaceae bacterium]|nr:hypothetical protein [Opitutaceae bacterium]
MFRMRKTIVLLMAVILFAAPLHSSGEEETQSFALPRIDLDPAPTGFPPDKVAFVLSWIRQVAPECPVEESAGIAQSFLEELSLRQPGEFDRLLSPQAPSRGLESMLLRHAGAKLVKAAPAERERIAERRVGVVLAESGQAVGDVGKLIGELRDRSSYQYRRLLEGRIDDNDLIVELRKITEPAAVAPAAPAAPKPLTADEIIAGVVRRNQTGTALSRLHAYTVEATLTTPTGRNERIVISKMRPNRLRLTRFENGLTAYVLGGVGESFWQQSAGQPPQFASGRDLGSLRYATEFADPLFEPNGCTFERLPDGREEGNEFHRILVHRKDGSEYVARIEHGSFRQIGRENWDKTVSHFSDFREIDGVTFAFREETTDPRGNRAVMILNRVVTNPGLIASYFTPSVEPGMDYFKLEQSLARPSSQASPGS